jgi:hypothetical protein
LRTLETPGTTPGASSGSWASDPLFPAYPPDAEGNCVDGVYVRVASWREFLTKVVRDATSDAGLETPPWAEVDAGESENESPDEDPIEASPGVDADAKECGTVCPPAAMETLVAGGGCAMSGGLTGRGRPVVGGFMIVAGGFRVARRRRLVRVGRTRP